MESPSIPLSLGFCLEDASDLQISSYSPTNQGSAGFFPLPRVDLPHVGTHICPTRRTDFLYKSKANPSSQRSGTLPPSHSLPSTPFSETQMTKATTSNLSATPTLSTTSPAEVTLRRSRSLSVLNGIPISKTPYNSQSSDAYSLTNPAGIQFDEGYFSENRLSELGALDNSKRCSCTVSEVPCELCLLSEYDARIQDPLDPDLLVASLPADHRCAPFSSERSSTPRHLMDLNQFPEPPCLRPSLVTRDTNSSEASWSSQGVFPLESWFDDSSDEETDAVSHPTSVKAKQRKWQIVEQSPSDLPFEIESTEDAFRYATVITTKKPKLVTISRSSSSMTIDPAEGFGANPVKDVGINIPERPVTPAQKYQEVSAFSPDTPKDRPDSGFALPSDSETASWAPVREFWSRASSPRESTELPALPPLFEENETGYFDRATTNRKLSSPFQKSLPSPSPSLRSMWGTPKFIHPPILSPAADIRPPPVPTMNQIQTVAELYSSVKTFPFDALHLSTPIISSLHSTTESNLLTPLQRIFPKGSIFLLDSLAAALVAQVWLKQTYQAQDSSEKSLSHDTFSISTDHNPSYYQARRQSDNILEEGIPRKARTTLGIHENPYVASFSTCLTSPPQTPGVQSQSRGSVFPDMSALLAGDQSWELQGKLDEIADRLLSLLCDREGKQGDDRIVLSSLKVAAQMVIEGIMNHATTAFI